MAGLTQESKPGTVVAANVESKKPWSSRVFAGSAVAVSALAVAGLLLLQKCETEPIMKTETKTIEVCSKPNKTDKKCEIDKGEHDPWSPLFDPSCAICGDAKLEAPETAETCPVDALCDNGKKDQGFHPAMVKVEGKEGVYTLGTVTVDECDKNNKFYCEVNCPPEEPKKVSGHRREHRETRVERPTTTVEACTHPMNATDLTNRVAGAMLGHAGDLRTLLDSQDAIKVTVKFLVDTG
ncbi:hypothetical protein H0O00_04605, partial [Candidatus Micrarchaeota archaeon]|nr:hypothetical protein [Candidatus Micrarchaeota archaeon]